MTIVLRVMLVVAIIAAWAWLTARELFPEPRRRSPDLSWPDAAVSPDSGKGGYFGRINASAE